MVSLNSKTGLYIIPYDFLTGRYLQIRVIVKSKSKQPVIKIFDKEGMLPFIVTRFVKFSGSKCSKTAIVFIRKTLLNKDTRITLQYFKNSTSIYCDDSEQVRQMRSTTVKPSRCH